MNIKIGDIVRESVNLDIGRVIAVPNDTNKYYIVSYDYSKSQYTQAQVDTGILRLLSKTVP